MLADIELVHQARDIACDLRIAPPLERMIAFGDVDDDFVDDAARPLAHDQHAVGQDHGFEQVMGDEQRGLPGFHQRLREIVLQHDAGLRIDRGERFVQQQHRGIDGEGARQRRALAHAAGQLMRVALGEFAKLEGIEKFAGLLSAVRRVELSDFGAQHHVLLDRAPGQQQILLQHEGDMVVRALDPLAVHERIADTRRIEP